MYCQLTPDEVVKQLKMHPIAGELGLTEDGVKVFYGNLDDQMGDMLEEGTVVYGHCYQCECKNMSLTCSMNDSCVCPNATVRCEGPCDAQEMVVEFDGDISGIPAHCLPDTQCDTPCTTPYTCPPPWSEWSECTNCVKQRTRRCYGECGDLCNNITTSEAEDCECTTMTPSYQPSYTPTPYCDQEHEEWGCYNHTVRCHESCLMVNNREACVNNSIDEDMPCNYSCKCEDGYARNSIGVCVKEEQCECYNGTIPLPHNYTEVRECEYCNCTMNYGYRCWTDPYCTTAHTPTMPTTFEPTTCYNPDQTPYQKYCNQTCYQTANCEEVCTDFVQNCTYDEWNCNNETHTTSWENVTDPCCPRCVTKPEVCQKHIVEQKNLTFTHNTAGICVSDPLDIAICKGACDWSESGGSHYQYNGVAGGLPLFDIDYYSNCKCCQAELSTKQVPFKCIPHGGTDSDEHTVDIAVTEIVGCNCKQCV